MPVASTIAYLFWASQIFEGAPRINLLYGVLALVGIIIFHAAGNVLSDYNDHRKGVDTPENAMMLPLVNGSFKPEEFKRYGIALLLVGCAMGVALLLGFLIGNMTLKPLISRVRPYDMPGVDIDLLVGHLGDKSFPSGHT
jgi:1,4-dihydroxy-2-naphthoate octaprenyltransferase